MSMAALRWARAVRGVTGTQKLVLWALADMANDYAEAWPTALSVADDCCISDRAVREAMDALEALGFITGQRATGRATRWLLNLAQTAAPQEPPTPAPRSATPAHGSDTSEPRSGVRGSASGTEPRSGTPEPRSGVVCANPGTTFLPPSEPRSGVPRNHVPGGSEPRSDITLKNPHITPIGTPKARERADVAVDVPGWIPIEAWAAWCQHRTRLKRSGWTQAAAVRCIATLTTLRDEGNDPQAVIDQSIAGGWTGLFALRGHRSAPPKRDRFDMLADAFGIPEAASPTVIDIAAERVA
jgi:hypothetical protein